MPSKKKQRTTERRAKRDAERAKKDAKRKQFEHHIVRMKSLWENQGMHDGMDCCVCYEKTLYVEGDSFEEQAWIERQRYDAGEDSSYKLYGFHCDEMHIICLKCLYHSSPGWTDFYKCPVCNQKVQIEPPTAITEEGGLRSDSKGTFYTKRGEKVYF